MLEQSGEDDGEEVLGVVADETHDVVVAPVVQGPLCNLVWAGRGVAREGKWALNRMKRARIRVATLIRAHQQPVYNAEQNSITQQGLDHTS